MKINILGICGSPRKAATYFSLNESLIAAKDISKTETDLIELKEKNINNCIHCDRCLGKDIKHCLTFDDDMNEYYDKLLKADGLIFASPVYQMAPSAQIVSFINRVRPLGKFITRGKWSLKVGGAIAVGGTRNGGQETTLETLNNFFLSQNMIVVGGGIFAYNGGSVWSKDKGKEGAQKDKTGLDTVRVIGRRVASVAKVLKKGKDIIGDEVCQANLIGYSDHKELEKRVKAFKSK